MATINPVIERAIQLQLRRDPPFTEEDLSTVEGLSVLSASDIGDLSRLTHLRALRLVGYDGFDLRPLVGLPIGVLEVEFSSVTDLAVTAMLPDLHTLNVPNNSIVEIEILAAADRRFDELDLTGNPLSEQAYHEVVPVLRDRMPHLRVSAEREWQLTRRLHAIGLPFDYYRDDEGYWLCRPGLEYTTFPDADHLAIEPDELEAILDRDPSEIPDMFLVRDES